MEELRAIKTIHAHTSMVCSLLLLNDKRVASCSGDQTIRIFNPSNDYHCDQVLKRHNNDIRSICQLDNGTIVSSSYQSIMIGDFLIKNAHDYWIWGVVALPNNRIASCSNDMVIKIWQGNSDTPIKVLAGHTSTVYSLMYIKGKNIMVSGSNDRTLRLCEVQTYQCVSVSVIVGINCFLPNSLYRIDKDRVIVGGNNTFCIVNIGKCVIENKIEDESLGFVYCFMKMNRYKTILCGCERNVLIL